MPDPELCSMHTCRPQKAQRHPERRRLWACILILGQVCALALFPSPAVAFDRQLRALTVNKQSMHSVKQQFVSKSVSHSNTTLSFTQTLGGRAEQHSHASTAWVSRSETRRRSRRKRHRVLPLSVLTVGHTGSKEKECPQACYERGVCNKEIGRCDCQRGWSGPACDHAPDDKGMQRMCRETHFLHYQGNCTDDAGANEPLVFCVNNCNGRGRCRAGWCHCEAGFWGMDCSLSLGADGKVEVLQGKGYTVRRRRPWVYVYDLPHRLTSWRNAAHHDRPLHIHLYQRLLASGALVSDPEQADYFFLPISVRAPTEGLLMESAVQYVRTFWPYWNKLQGRRHIILHTGDTGRAELTWHSQRLVKNVTMLSHWGLTQDYSMSGWKASHKVNQDLVVPVLIPALGTRSVGLQESPLHPKAETKHAPKDIELLFAGRICGGRDAPDGTKKRNCQNVNKGYSQGVRQLVHKHHWNRTGFVIAVSVEGYFDKLTRTRFCLAPSGGGHGHRQILVAFSGCTPLVISDHVLQPYEPFMDWSRFSVTLPQSDIPRLHEILPTISPDTYKDLQDAYETIMEILRMMLKYPDLPHDQFATRDPEFKAFMECRSDEFYAVQGADLADTAGHVPAPKRDSGSPLCSVSRWDKGHSCEECILKWGRAPPGGALCCAHVDNLARCPRLWA